MWPVFGLRVRCGPLELSAIRDDDIPVLMDLVRDGVHDPDAMPFFFPWTTLSEPKRTHGFAAHHWRVRADFSVEKWTLELAVRRDGEIVGSQGISTHDYLVTRTGETGSWLGRRYQGQGTGTLMRQVMCAFVFDHLDAAEITSAAFIDNPASLAVSRKVGYVANGDTRLQRRPGEMAVNRRLLLTPDALVRPEFPVEGEGVESFRRLIGLEPPSTAAG